MRENAGLNSSELSRRACIGAALWGGLFAATNALAAPAEICQRTPAAKQDALLVVDSAFRLVNGKVLHVGDVDFSTSREPSQKYLVVAPLRAQPMTNLGSIDMGSDLELLQRCPGKNVFALNISFDSSPLPAGPFSQPLYVFQDEFGMKGKPLSASIETVTGTIQRFRIQADLSSSKQSADATIELRLTNNGNQKSAPLRFGPLWGSQSIQVGVNECKDRSLAQAETCVIELLVSGQVPADEAFEWPVEVGKSSLLTLQFDRRHGAPLQVNARNR